jgi:hypothetical protein
MARNGTRQLAPNAAGPEDVLATASILTASQYKSQEQ